MRLLFHGDNATIVRSIEDVKDTDGFKKHSIDFDYFLRFHRVAFKSEENVRICNFQLQSASFVALSHQNSKSSEAGKHLRKCALGVRHIPSHSTIYHHSLPRLC